MKQILKDVLKGLLSIFFPPTYKYKRPILCQCTRCGDWHYKASFE